MSSRRNFLQIVGGVIVASPFGSGCTDDEPGDERTPNVSYTLAAQWLYTTMDDLKVKLRSYNGKVPGELLELSPGDLLEITLDNRLTPYDSSRWNKNHNVPHDLNTTNLHLHGLDVIPHLFAPLGTSDPHSDMIEIAPGETFTYLFDIPMDQPPGLYWYHPHKHGSTAVQAVSGMAGIIIVSGPIDEVPEIAAARDERIVVSDIGLFQSDDEPDVWVYEPRQNAIWNTFGAEAEQNLVRVWEPLVNVVGGWVDKPELKGGFTTGDYAVRFYCVNGTPFYREDHDPAGGISPIGKKLPSDADVYTKQIDMQPGEVVRLRILNACSDLLLPLVLEGLDMHLIGLDGVPFTAPRMMKTVEPAEDKETGQWDGVVDYNADATSLVLAPGNRAELLLKAPDAPGTYHLVQLSHKTQQFLNAERKVIAAIVVSGEPKPMRLPTALPGASRYEPIQESELAETRELHFTGAFPGKQNPVVGIDFSINDVQYDMHTINTSVKLNTAEVWKLSAMKHDHGNSEGHPFHIHANSFEVKTINGVPQPAGTIMDTLWTGADQTNVVWMRFKQWTGKTVYHCHILPHEDTGMMQNFLIE